MKCYISITGQPQGNNKLEMKLGKRSIDFHRKKILKKLTSH